MYTVGNPLFLFIYKFSSSCTGGAYQTGSANGAIYNGHALAATGRAIFIALNYRINVWGFPSTIPVTGVDQNVGVSDVRLALKWVANNIDKFGGDSSRIILSGQSSGAAIGETLLYAFKDDPVVAGQIGSSGTIGTIGATPADGTMWNLLANTLGCGNSTDSTQVSLIAPHCDVKADISQISCMRNVSFDKIKNTALQQRQYFGATADGSLVFTNDDYLDKGANGSYAQVPALLSTVNDEGSLFIEPYSSLYPNTTTADFVADTIDCPLGKYILQKQQPTNLIMRNSPRSGQ